MATSDFDEKWALIHIVTLHICAILLCFQSFPFIFGFNNLAMICLEYSFICIYPA